MRRIISVANEIPTNTYWFISLFRQINWFLDSRSHVNHISWELAAFSIRPIRNTKQAVTIRVEFIYWQ